MSYNFRNNGRGANHPSGGQRQSGPANQQQMRNMNQTQQQAQAQRAQVNLRQQAQQFLQEQNLQHQPALPQQSVQQPKPVQPPIKPLLATKLPPPVPKPMQDPVVKLEPIVANTAVLPAASNGHEISVDVPEEGTDKTPKAKPFWAKASGKVNKKELRRRRNQRLRKILQPKNALMVLNELVGSTPYEVAESPDLFSGMLFKCTVLVDGTEHAGLGKSKPAAKNAAAEAALKHMVLSKVKTSQPIDTGINTETDTGDAKMEVDENVEGISWSHVACYALHKLLNSWDDGTNLNLSEKVAYSGSIDGSDVNKVLEKKPAKKLPDSANTMNPIMLLNQMLPNSSFEEVARTGNPPNVNFTVKCVAGTSSFLGKGTTKKAARKMCAFAACREVLGITYTPEFFEAQGFSEDCIQIVS